MSLLRNLSVFLSPLLLSSLSLAKLPSMDIQFGGPLQRSCSFVDNSDVIESLESTIATLNQIQEVEKQCQNILINSRAFMQSSLENAIATSSELRVSKSNRSTIKKIIEDKIASGEVYSGEYDSDLLAAEIEVAKNKNEGESSDVKVANTMQLGIALFRDLKDAPPTCSQSFGSELLSPAVGIVGQALGGINPSVGLAANLLTSIIDYGNTALSRSYISLRELTEAKNFHMTYKCTMKNIEDILCRLEEQEKAIESSQTQSEKDNFMSNYRKKILSYDNKDEDFKKWHHLKRHRFRISKMIENLDNIYRSPETAEDLEKVVSYQTSFSRLSLMARLNPLRNEAYIKAMIDAGHMRAGEIEPNWSTWDNNKAIWRSWSSQFFGQTFRELIKTNCSKIDTKKYPELIGIYNANMQDCNFRFLREEKTITSFINVVIVPALVFVQGDMKRLNEKIKENANLHGLFTYINDQSINTGDINFQEYSLGELLDLYRKHAVQNAQTSLRFYVQDIIVIMDALKTLISENTSLNESYDDFALATKEAYIQIAKVSNNGAEGGILYRSIIESKITSYIDGIQNNYTLNEDKKLAERFSNFRFHIENFERLDEGNVKMNSSGSSNIALMESVKSAFLRTFEPSIQRVLTQNIKNFKKNTSLKRDLVHSCAIFYPSLKKKGTRLARRINGKKKLFSSGANPVLRFCKKLLEQENGIYLFSNSSEKFPLQSIDDGLNFSNRCYYKKYEEAVLIFRMNKAKRNRYRFRI